MYTIVSLGLIQRAWRMAISLYAGMPRRGGVVRAALFRLCVYFSYCVLYLRGRKWYLIGQEHRSWPFARCRRQKKKENREFTGKSKQTSPSSSTMGNHRRHRQRFFFFLPCATGSYQIPGIAKPPSFVPATTCCCRLVGRLYM